MLEFLWKSCTHDKITLNIKAGYCPDCGKYVKNHWYITRCECCGLKQKTLVRNGKVIAYAKFCKNCGSSSFMQEELDTLDIVSVNYAAVWKKVKDSKKPSVVQTWIENGYTPMKLLPSY